MADPKLFILTLSDGSGNYASLMLDEAVSDEPEFLVATLREMKQRLATAAPEPGRRIEIDREAAAIIKGVHNEHVDPTPSDVDWAGLEKQPRGHA